MVGFPTTFSNTHLPVKVHEAVSAKDTPAPALACYPPDSDSNISNLSDEELMQFLKCGRQDALTVLFDRYHHLVFSIALRIVRDPGEAEEVVQIVFLDRDGSCSSPTMGPCTGSGTLLPTTSTVGRNSKLY